MHGLGMKAWEVFSRTAKIMQRDRAALDKVRSREVDYLKRELAKRTVERLSLISKPLPRIVDMGAGAAYILQEICSGKDSNAETVRSRLLNSKTEFTLVEGSSALLRRDKLPQTFKYREVLSDIEDFRAAPATFDCCLTSGSLHWVNDLPGVLKGINEMLVPDGVFLGNIVGGDSLFELRTSMQLAEMEQHGRVSPRLSPLAGPSDVANLLQQAKFKLLTVDVEDIVVDYPDMFALVEDLHQMGESNAVQVRPVTVPKSLLASASHIYREMHGNPDGSVPATFRIVQFIGWKESPNQPKPMPAMPQINLKDLGKDA